MQSRQTDLLNRQLKNTDPAGARVGVFCMGGSIAKAFRHQEKIERIGFRFRPKQEATKKRLKLTR